MWEQVRKTKLVSQDQQQSELNKIIIRESLGIKKHNHCIAAACMLQVG